MENKKTAGKLIVFEGIDGSGKSTQIELLRQTLKERKIPFYVTMEPSERPIGSMIRQILTGKAHADPKVIAALFTADRLDHLLNEVNGIAHMVEQGMLVLMDRYYFSSYAYQSVDAPMDWVIQANALSAQTLRPAVNIFLDVDAEDALERITKNRGRTELFEEKERLIQVRERYMEAFEKLKDAERVEMVDGSREKDEIAKDVWGIVSALLDRDLKS